VGSQLVSTLPICYGEGTKHAPGRTTLTVYGKFWCESNRVTDPDRRTSRATKENRTSQ